MNDEKLFQVNLGDRPFYRACLFCYNSIKRYTIRSDNVLLLLLLCVLIERNYENIENNKCFASSLYADFSIYYA